MNLQHFHLFNLKHIILRSIQFKNYYKTSQSIQHHTIQSYRCRLINKINMEMEIGIQAIIKTNKYNKCNNHNKCNSQIN